MRWRSHAIKSATGQSEPSRPGPARYSSGPAGWSCNLQFGYALDGYAYRAVNRQVSRTLSH